jgi:2-methylcitrate dehydratase PrpD
MHGAVDAAAKCMKENHLTLSDVKAINVHTFKLAFEEGNRPQPQTVLDAQFSIHYNVAAYLRKGALGVEDFAPAALREPKVRDLCQKIKVFESPDLSKNYPAQWPFRVEIISQDGNAFSHQVSFPPGSAANPLEPEEFEKKCLLLLKPVMPEKRAKEMLLRLQCLEDFATAANLMSYLQEVMV